MIESYIFVGIIAIGLVILAFGPFVLSSNLTRKDEEYEAAQRKLAAEKPCAEILIDGVPYLLYPTKDGCTYRCEKKGIVPDKIQNSNHHLYPEYLQGSLSPTGPCYDQSDPLNGVPQ